MVHTRMSALGWVIGGSETVVRALLDVARAARARSWPTPRGRSTSTTPRTGRPSIATPTSPSRRCSTSRPPRSTRDYGRIPERVRTWPGARRSGHPEASVVAVGARAAWLCDAQPDDDAYGARSPFARLVEAGGQVLMLGAPLDTITLLHHAEAIARVPRKRRVTFEVLVAQDGDVVERTYTDIDTSEPGALPYEQLGLDEDDVRGHRPRRARRRDRRPRPGRAGRLPPLRRRRAHALRRRLDGGALRRAGCQGASEP